MKRGGGCARAPGARSATGAAKTCTVAEPRNSVQSATRGPACSTNARAMQARQRKSGRSRLCPDLDAAIESRRRWQLTPLAARAPVRIENLDHLRVHLRIAGDDLVLVQEIRFARVVADEPARFRDQQAARCHVPRVDALFEEAVDAARRDVREIERGRARTAQARARQRHFGEERAVGFEAVPSRNGKPVPISASARRSRLPTRMRRSFRYAPRPRDAVKRSLRVGS